MGVRVIVGVIVAVGLGVDERNGTRGLVGVRVGVGFGVFVGGGGLPGARKMSGKYNSFCASINSNL